MYKSVEIAKYYTLSVPSLFVNLHFYYHYKKNREVAMSFNSVYLNMHAQTQFSLSLCDVPGSWCVLALFEPSEHP